MQSNILNAQDLMNLKDRIDNTNKSEVKEKLLINLCRGPFEGKNNHRIGVYWWRYQPSGNKITYYENSERYKGKSPFSRCIKRLKEIKKEYGDLDFISYPLFKEHEKIPNEELERILNYINKG